MPEGDSPRGSPQYGGDDDPERDDSRQVRAPRTGNLCASPLPHQLSGSSRGSPHPTATLRRPSTFRAWVMTRT